MLVGILIGSVGILIGSVGILIGSVGILIHWYFEHWYFERWYFEPLPPNEDKEVARNVGDGVCDHVGDNIYVCCWGNSGH